MKRVVVDTNVIIYKITKSNLREEVKSHLKSVDLVYIPTHILIELIIVMKAKLELEDNVIFRIIEKL